MTEDEDLEKDVAQLRAKWFGADAAPRRALDAEEEAVAARWLGKHEAARLATTRSGERFRYRPTVVIAHYGYIPFSEGTHALHPLGDYFYLEVFKLGRKHTLFQGDRASCLKAVERLRSMGISVSRVGSERSPEEISPLGSATPSRHQRPSQRKVILDQLKGWRA